MQKISFLGRKVRAVDVVQTDKQTDKQTYIRPNIYEYIKRYSMINCGLKTRGKTSEGRSHKGHPK